MLSPSMKGSNQGNVTGLVCNWMLTEGSVPDGLLQLGASYIVTEPLSIRAGSYHLAFSLASEV